MGLSNNTGPASLGDIKRDFSRIFFVVWSLLFLIRLLGPGWRQGFPTSFPDSATFLNSTLLGPFSIEFWFADRPVGLPIVLWLVQSNIRAFIVLQTALYIAAAVFLFQTILNSLANRIAAWIAVVSVAMMFSHYKFAMWNLEVLSESLILSTTTIGVALLLRLSQLPTKKDIIRLCYVLVALLLLRDVNSILAILAILAILVYRRHPDLIMHRRLLMKVVVVLAVGCLYVLIAQSESQRFQYGVMNNVGLRVLTEKPVATNVFGDNSPLLKLLEGRAGKSAWDDNQALLVEPALQPFRDWVYSSGRGELMQSLISEPQFWQNQISSGIDSSLSYNFADYDRFGSANRLNVPLDNGMIPSSLTKFMAFMALSLLACAIAMTYERRYALYRMLFFLQGISFLFLVISVFADAVEVQRHSLPPLLMAMLTMVVVFALSFDVMISRFCAPSAIRPERTNLPLVTTIAGGALLVLSMMSLIALEFRTQDWDPSFARTIIERVGRFGGTYYQNGIWHHGPIDALLYDIPRFFTTFGTYWFGVALIVMAMSSLVSYSIIRISRYFETKNSISLALGIAIFFHFTISSSDYAGVIYSRNTTTTILISVFAFSLTGRPWASPQVANRSFIFAFVLLGLAVQTMVSSVLTAVVVGMCIFLLHRQNVAFRRPCLWAFSSFLFAIATAPLWYFIRGSINEFWANWWVMARHMNTATNRSLANQFALGWDKFYEYYTQRPVLFFIISAFVLLLIKNFRSMTPARRLINVTVLLWFFAAWCELVISQRYSSHYFVIPTIPTAIMLAVVVSHFFSSTTKSTVKPIRKSSVVPSVLVSLALLVTQCSDLFWSGVEGLGRFQSIRQHQQFVADTRSGESKTIRAVLDLTSSDNDALLAWTMFPWTYLDFQRVPATRLSWKSFMLGEIYLASTSEEYILPDTWKWFAADMKQSQPTAYLHPKEVAFVDNTPFASYVKENFDVAMATEKHTVSINKTIWAAITAPLSSGVELSTPIELALGNAPQDIALEQCQRLDVTLSKSISAPDGSVEFIFQQASDRAPQSVIRVDSTQIQALANGYPQHSQTLVNPFNEAITLSIFLGTRSAAVVINGQIATAIRLVSPTGVSLTSTNGSTTVTQSVTAPAPYLNNCT